MKLTNRLIILLALALAVITLGIAGPAIAQDLSDPATCLECHADSERAPPSNPNRPHVVLHRLPHLHRCNPPRRRRGGHGSRLPELPRRTADQVIDASF